METKFNSQICTTREQSERLLALGLKKETADMRRPHYNEHTPWVIDERDCLNEHWLPAWSLHRLMEMTDPWEYKNWIGEDIENDYDNMIQCIEFLIDDRRFNKEYLED